MSWFGLAIVFSFAGASVGISASAQDDPASESSWKPEAAVRFWLEPTREDSRWFAPEIVMEQGTITRFDNNSFAARTATGEVLAAARRVLWCEPVDTPDVEKKASDLFHQGDFEASLPALLAAISARPPVWRQQWLSMLAAQAAYRSGRHELSLELVHQLDQRPLPPVVLSYLPIDWNRQAIDDTSQSRALADSAIKRLNDSSPAARLVAASWLVQSPRRGEAAKALGAIAAQTERSDLAMLAYAVRWRLATPPDVTDQWRQWLTWTDRIPMVFQTGPTLVLVDKMRAAQLANEGAWLNQSLLATPIHPHPDLPKSGSPTTEPRR